MRLLILACSATKRPDNALLPALHRYDGPAWRTLRAYLDRAGAHADDLEVYALSAEFGLFPAIQPIPNYDRRMDMARAVELRPQALAALTLRLQQLPRTAACFTHTLIWGGRCYQTVLPLCRSPAVS